MADTVDPKSFYGYLFDANKQPSKVLDALLKGIASYIIENIGDVSEKWLRPEKMAAFYRAVGGNYDSIFMDTPPSSLSLIYASIGCQHILLPSTDDFVPPYIPSLTISGYVTWQSIEILLGPEEHVPFIQKCLRLFDIRHPETDERFPVDLPTDAFPLAPDPEIESWHEQCANLLRLRTIEPENEKANSPSKPETQKAESRHQNRCQGEYLRSRSQIYERPDLKTRLRQTKSCFSGNGKNISISIPLDLGLQEIVVEVDRKKSRRPKPEHFRQNSLPVQLNEKKDKNPENDRSESDEEFSAHFGMPSSKPRFFHSHHTRNRDNDIHTRLPNTVHGHKRMNEPICLAYGSRPNYITRYPSSNMSRQNGYGKSHLDGEEIYFRDNTMYDDKRNNYSEIIDHGEDRRHSSGNRGGSIKWRDITSVVATLDDTVSQNIRDSNKKYRWDSDQKRDKNPGSHGKKKDSYEDITPRERCQDWARSSNGIKFKGKEPDRYHNISRTAKVLTSETTTFVHESR